MDKGNDLSQIQSPRLENTYNTIRQYHSAWFHSNNDTSSTNSNELTEEELQIVSYLNDTACIQILSETEPKLVPYFKNEKSGKYKGDICRTAELYKRGGYYFDTDMQVVKPLQIEPHITFTAPFEAGISDDGNNRGIFNSFIASAPNHPILRNALDLMLKNYEGTK